jgi:hypothetical protein
MTGAVESELRVFGCGLRYKFLVATSQVRSRKMPTQPACILTVQGLDGNPRILIHNPLDGLPELGDSSLIQGNAPADTKRLVKNVFDAYGVGKQGSFAKSVGESVRLVEVCVNGHNHQPLEPVGPKGRLEASTTAELTVSQRASIDR